jgi:hypothetical protein
MPKDLNYAHEVHRWGFGGADIPNAIVSHPNFHGALANFFKFWSAGPSPWVSTNGQVGPGIQALIALLGIPGLGIARVSKWACFLDQSQYAIYDSRVAYALRDLLSQAGLRIFPFVGGRPAPNGQPRRINGDALIVNPARATTAFVNFLLVIRNVANSLNASQPLSKENIKIVGNIWTPALVEVALFNIGIGRIRLPGIAQVDGKVNKSWP